LGKENPLYAAKGKKQSIKSEFTLTQIPVKPPELEETRLNYSNCTQSKLLK
jgi:hypothetical protein